MGFCKLDSGITKSSLWGEPEHIRVVWISFLAEKDHNGFVASSYSGMRRTANLLNDPDGKKFDEAIICLESPDPDSRTKDNEGRRISRVEGGWIVLNHKKYREFSYSDSTGAKRQKRYRERKKNKDENVTRYGSYDSNGNASVSVSASVSDILNKTEKEKEGMGEKEKTNPKWTENNDEAFKEYLRLSEPEWDKLMTDWSFIEKMKTRIPNTNIRESIEKAWDDFWGEKEGWENKKEAYRAAKRKAAKNKVADFEYQINWEKTIQKTLHLSRVPIPFGKPDVEQQTIEMMKRRDEKENS